MILSSCLWCTRGRWDVCYALGGVVFPEAASRWSFASMEILRSTVLPDVRPLDSDILHQETRFALFGCLV